MGTNQVRVALSAPLPPCHEQPNAGLVGMITLRGELIVAPLLLVVEVLAVAAR